MSSRVQRLDLLEVHTGYRRMKMTLKRRLGMVASWVVAGMLVSTARSAVERVVYYPFGETGTVGTSPSFTPIVDMEGNGGVNSLTSATAGTATLVTATPGGLSSTEALENNGVVWYNISGLSETDNWALDFWLKPRTDGGTYVAGTDDSNSGLTLHAENTGQGHRLKWFRNGSGEDPIYGPVYSVGTWYRITLIAHDGTVYYYADHELLDSSSGFASRLLEQIRFGNGAGASAATDAQYDEVQIWTFDSTDALSTVEAAVFGSFYGPHQIAYYPLGEDGSVGTIENKFLPISDLEPLSGDNDFDWQYGLVTNDISLLTTGLEAPGSTVALRKSGGGTYDRWDTGNTFSSTNNWALSMWIQPQKSSGSYVMSTGADGSADEIFLHATFPGTMDCRRRGGQTITGPAYTVGNWYHYTIIVNEGTLYYYLGQDLIGTMTVAGGYELQRLSMGSEGHYHVPTNADFDEWTVWEWMHATQHQLEHDVLGIIRGTLITVQ
jgi:hypothetical protein